MSDSTDLPAPWRPFDWSKSITKKMIDSYIDFIRDDVGIHGFIQWLAGSIVLVTDDGWVAIDEVRPELSACIHGGKWNPAASIDEDFENICKYLFTALNLKVLVAKVVDGSHAAKLVERAEFRRCGVIPCEGMYGGAPRNLTIYARFI